MTDVWTGGTKFGATTVAINNSGHFVVNYTLDAAGDTESFLYNGVIWIDLRVGGATGMNASDRVVGNGPHGYWLYADGLLLNPPGYFIPGGQRPVAYSINDTGSTAGECQQADPIDHGQNGCVFGPYGWAVLYRADLGQLSPFPPYAIALNGDTCGMNGVSQFATWSNTGTETYAVSIGDQSQCSGLDDYGDSVGFGYPTNVAFNNDGFIYGPVNKLRDLNNLVSHIYRKAMPSAFKRRYPSRILGT